MDRRASFTFDNQWGNCTHQLLERVEPELDSSLGWVLRLRFPCVRVFRVYSDIDGDMSESRTGSHTFTVDIDELKEPPVNKLINLQGIRALRDVYYVHYETLEKDCPKCVNLGALADVYINPANRTFGMMEGKYKLASDLRRFLLTDRYSSHYYWYGSKLPSMMSDKFLSFSTARVVEEINTCMRVSKIMQSVRVRRQYLLDTEIIHSFEGLGIEATPEGIDVKFTVITKSAKNVNLNFTL